MLRGDKSRERLQTCDEQLQMVILRVAETFDLVVLAGHRGQAEQDAAVRSGNSKTPWPTSKHNKVPSLAVDVAPFPIDWNDRERFALLAGHVLSTAKEMGIDLRWGGDWDRDGQTRDEKFSDMPHFELVEPT